MGYSDTGLNNGHISRPTIANAHNGISSKNPMSGTKSNGGGHNDEPKLAHHTLPSSAEPGNRFPVIALAFGVGLSFGYLLGSMRRR
jgi:hypothetical protein